MYYITRQTNECIDYFNKNKRSFHHSLSNIKGGYKTLEGANKKLKILRGIYKSYFDQSSFDNIRNRDINDFLYITKL